MDASDPPGTGLWEETIGSSSDGYSFFDLDSFINLDRSTTTTDSMSTDDIEHRNMFRLSIDGNSSNSNSNSNMANHDNDTDTSPPTSYGSDEQTVIVCVPPVGDAVDLDEDAHLDTFGNKAAGATAQQQQQQQQRFYQQKQVEPQLELLHRRRHLSSPASRSLEVAASVSDSEILRLEDLSVCSPRRPVAAAHVVPASAPGLAARLAHKSPARAAPP
ncbi:hypothetical protein MAPG_05506, partial [Magnaporthiopsis poae ATCC 64411]